MDVKPYGKYAKAMIFLKWFKKAKTIDQLDSPILYNFYNQVVKPKLEGEIFADIERLRKKYLSDHQVINIIDHGAGSSTSRSKQRSISSIASSAVSGPSKCQLLYKTCQQLKAQSILELGTSLGISALYMKQANQGGQLTTVEGDPKIGAMVKPSLEQKGIRSLIGTFDEVLVTLSEEKHSYDLVYIDGGHRSDILHKVMSLLHPLTSPKTILIIDDIYWSADMTQAWEQLKSSDAYNVAIDLWHFGILYHDEKAKESIEVKMSPIDRRWTFGFFR